MKAYGLSVQLGMILRDMGNEQEADLNPLCLPTGIWA